MTLIVSLRIPDGIVLAGDSLATMMGNLQPHVQFDVVCPHCGKPHKVDGDLPPIALPSTVSEIEVVIVNKPITDNSGETLETINLTSAFGEIRAQPKDIVVKVLPINDNENKNAG